jgi:uncharacterized protein with PQ loop repeat
MSAIDIIGMIAFMCMSFATVPQLIKSFRERHCDGISWGYIIALQLGFILMFLHVAITSPNIFVLANYGVKIGSLKKKS